MQVYRRFYHHLERSELHLHQGRCEDLGLGKQGEKRTAMNLSSSHSECSHRSMKQWLTAVEIYIAGASFD